jgi:hypothetical protein
MIILYFSLVIPHMVVLHLTTCSSRSDLNARTPKVVVRFEIQLDSQVD